MEYLYIVLLTIPALIWEASDRVWKFTKGTHWDWYSPMAKTREIYGNR